MCVLRSAQPGLQPHTDRECLETHAATLRDIKHKYRERKPHPEHRKLLAADVATLNAIFERFVSCVTCPVCHAAATITVFDDRNPKRTPGTYSVARKERYAKKVVKF